MEPLMSAVASDPVALPAASGRAPGYFQDLASRGMLLSHWAREQPDDLAIISRRGNRTFAELNANANRLLNHWRGAGLEPGAAVAVICGNVPQFVEAILASQRGGFRITPVNWHLTPDEVAYILGDCSAEAWIVQSEFAGRIATADRRRLKSLLVVGGEGRGLDSYASALAGESGADPQDPILGRSMLYTSGTTGRPKGVIKGAAWLLLPQREGTRSNYRRGDVNLLCGPGYHGGPLAFDIAYPLASGAAILMMEKFDAAHALTLIERHRVTHSHMVTTMFQRLLALPADVRCNFDTSSLRLIVHGAAPTPPEVKRGMIEWLGPILWEYYAATEASAGIGISSEEWLRKPGSVGRVPAESGVCVLDDDGSACAPGEAGRICFRNSPTARTQYHNAPEKNAEVFASEYFTVGDIGYVDDEGYLFLTGRSADTIISGGVNIYPQEIDNALLSHPAIRQSCTIGVPDDEWGEAVRAVVSLQPGYSPCADLAEQLIGVARALLPSYKAPRAVDFVDEIPESEAGKVLRAKVRAAYWVGRERQI